MKNKLLSYVSEKIHWRHFFGGLSFILIILQLIIGIFLIFFYEPSLSDAYKSVQHLTNNVTGGSLLRNLHRWIAFSLFLSIIIHTIRCILRLDFFSQAKRILWLTGVISLLPLFLLIITGVILPWEWKGYWFMEIIPNYSEFVPFIGSELKTFFINTFTLPRYEVIHILLLPMTLLILVDYHFLNRLRKRGVFQYIFRHTIISLPILVVLLVLSKYITIPTEDPQVVPLPLEGGYIPAAEWYSLIPLLPLMYYKGKLIPLLSIYLPLAAFLSFAFLPYYLRSRIVQEADIIRENNNSGGGIFKKVVKGFIVILLFAVISSLIYLGAYNSPTFGCNSCHNLNNGIRMGVPPAASKDRNALPNLNDNQWMMGHWFYPDIVY
jgi:hypothetical protein